MYKKSAARKYPGCFFILSCLLGRHRLSRVRRRVIREILHGIGFPHVTCFVSLLYHGQKKIREETLKQL